MRRAATLALLASSFVPVAAMAAETIDYRYDARGRLVKVERAGSVNNNISTSYCYDHAHNRLGRKVSLDGTVCTNAPGGGGTVGGGTGGGGTGGGTPANSPPVATNDAIFLQTYTNYAFLDLIANDTDPEGDTPLTLEAISASSPYATASVGSGTTAVISTGAAAGTAVFTYVVKDSKGATSTGNFTVTVTELILEEPPLCNGVPC